MATALSVLAGTGLSSSSAPASAAATMPAAEVANAQTTGISSQPAAGATAADAVSATTNGCSYANAGTSTAEYQNTLCWLDLSGVTTAYQQASTSTVRNGTSTRPYSYTTTLVYESVLGSSYGSVTSTGTSTNNNQTTAQQNSVTVAQNNLVTAQGLYSNGSTYFGNLTNYPINIGLANGLTLKADLDITAAAQNSGHNVSANIFPTWDQGSVGGSFLGRNGYYEFPSDIKNTVKPALYQQSQSGQTVVNLKNIRLLQGTTAVSGYSIVAADAESTDNGEWIEWTTDGGSNFKWLPTNPSAFATATTNPARKTAAVGDACQASSTSFWPALDSGTKTITCSATSNQGSPKTGTPMLQVSPVSAQKTFNVQQTMKGNGRQAVAFGLLMAKTSITTNVKDRIVGTDGSPTGGDFSANLTSPITVISNTGSTATSATTGDQQFPVDANGTQLAFSSVASGANAFSYSAAWVCTKTPAGAGENGTWTGTSAPQTGNGQVDQTWFTLKPGQFIGCTVTYTPPYVTLAKKAFAPDGKTAAVDAPSAWNLSLSNQTPGAASAKTVSGSVDGVKIPVATGTYSLTEAPAGTLSWAYGYDWTDLVCKPTGATATTVSSPNLKVDLGSAITCTFTNVARQPQLVVSKTADPATGTTVDASTDADEEKSVVKYKLTFDNRDGTYDAAIDHVDHLRDVLDDAEFNAESIKVCDDLNATYDNCANMTSSGVTVTDKSADSTPTLAITGTVLRGQSRVVWFTVNVKKNSDGASDRQAESAPLQGYDLRNYVTPRLDASGNTVTPPTTCMQPTDSTTPSTCTEHPIKAWSVSKTSLPVDGARLHKGGNVHYRLAATKLSSGTAIDDLQFTDDLTQVFKTAGWAPNAAVPGGARSRGIYFFDAAGNSLDSSGTVNGTSTSPVAAYAGDAGVPAPSQDASSGRWLLQTTKVKVPAGAVSAEAWFAVQLAESPVGIPTAWGSTPQSGSKFVNYATAESSTLAPTICGTDETAQPDVSINPTADDPADENFPAQCRVTHELRDNFFTIRKDASGVGEDLERGGAWGTDTTGLWNMVGHEFEVQDDDNGKPSGKPSLKLCRTDYNPGTGWDGTFTGSGDADWGQNSATLQAIKDWNNSHDSQLPLCALLYAQPDGSGGQTGRWRSENLSEGDYWLIETKAPTEQISLDGSQRRAINGVQLLSEPIAFTIWPDADGEAIPVPDNEGQAQKGRGQLDIKNADDGLVGRCLPGADVGERPVACVNPTGYLMIVKDSVPAQLPLTGGQWLYATLIAGGIVLGGSFGGALWWRRRQSQTVKPHGKHA
ncbi:hypothetical protein [Pseudoclavibacter sp. CFCC 11306]|uniref:DUF7927 domain-containing protein n=1 Tax=Pseudoclavibacter sp. CFCC 11306 TaxID=1564493 RepID=UPI0017878B83|nr:hypothetical protein [Pseudoclavibacter sp. CFCC 11306]